MRILDRYVFKNFLAPFFLCFFGFLSIWLVFDFMNNANEFIENKFSFHRIAYFYATQLPQVLVLSLPLDVLLALLFSLSRMSRSNEIISMLTAGRSVTRILYPLLFMGLLATAASTALDYELAPHAAAARQALQDEFKGRGGKPLEEQLFRNRLNYRTWYVQKIRPDLSALEGLHITQQDAQGNFVAKYYARLGVYDPVGKAWNLRNARIVSFDREGNVTTTENTPARRMTGWSETPWRIVSSNLDPENLSVPELKDYLVDNSDFPAVQLAAYRTYIDYRYAVPWCCLVIVFIASPLGIVFSRRGVLAGVASSIFIFFSLFFLSYLFLALGKGGRIPPLVAAWAPNASFATVGLFLLWMRSTNRDLPMLKNPFGKKPRARTAPSEPRKLPLPKALPETMAKSE
jgi:lipopolysaccharide export system permease protein